LLQFLQIADKNGEVTLTLTKPDGQPFTLSIAPAKTNTTFSLVTAQAALHLPVPLYRKHNDIYWFEYLPESKALYIQYDACQNDPKKPFKDFARELFAYADTNGVERTIVDLRFNSGGDSSVADPLLKGLRTRPSLNAPGHLFVLTGPMTFSSGEDAVENFHNSFDIATPKMVDGFYWIHSQKTDAPSTRFNATLVGEPTGGKPNCFGEVKTFELPNSKLNVAYTIKYFQLASDGDPLTREPDITVTRSLADYLAGRDPVLETVLKLPSNPPPQNPSSRRLEN
jgi:C-terminal processing protease CtpA/Prc